MLLSSPNTDGFYRFYISQGSVAMQLRCGGRRMFSNHFITYFAQNAPLKNFGESLIFVTWQRYGRKLAAYLSSYFFFLGGGTPCT